MNSLFPVLAKPLAPSSPICLSIGGAQWRTSTSGGVIVGTRAQGDGAAARGRRGRRVVASDMNMREIEQERVRIGGDYEEVKRMSWMVARLDSVFFIKNRHL